MGYITLLQRCRSSSSNIIKVNHYIFGRCSYRYCCLLLFSIIISTIPLTAKSLPAGKKNRNSVKVYRYFGFGSNVLPSTMKALRQVKVQDAVAALLPHYELRFYGADSGSRKQLFETSSAFVEPTSTSDILGDRRSWSEGVDNEPRSHSSLSSVVHGVLYTLSEEDFVKVGCSEGVPWAYRWQQCHVYPYQGDGKLAGYNSLTSNNNSPVEAYTLVVPPLSSGQRQRQQIAPSSSYLGLIQEGARLWQFDEDYQNQLKDVEVASNLLLTPEGLSDRVLRLAENAAGIDGTYKIRVSKVKCYYDNDMLL